MQGRGARGPGLRGLDPTHLHTHTHTGHRQTGTQTGTQTHTDRQAHMPQADRQAGRQIGSLTVRQVCCEGCLGVLAVGHQLPGQEVHLDDLRRPQSEHSAAAAATQDICDICSTSHTSTMSLSRSHTSTMSLSRSHTSMAARHRRRRRKEREWRNTGVKHVAIATSVS